MEQNLSLTVIYLINFKLHRHAASNQNRKIKDLFHPLTQLYLCFDAADVRNIFL
jgi:hypothetical protein